MESGESVKITFGSFLTQKRMEREITLREFARRIKVSPEYICNIEKSRRSAPGQEILERFAEVLDLSKSEREEMYDLAVHSKNTDNAVPEDLTGFLNDNRVVLTALRTAKEFDATDEEWEQFMKMLRANREEKKD